MKVLERSRRSASARALVVVLLVLAAMAGWLSPLDEQAGESLAAGTKRAFLTFATARSLNAAISVMQGTEITGGVGLSATFSVGEVLDPINDLVEQFAELMLFATVAFGIQEVLIAMGGHPAVQVFLAGLVAAWGAWYLTGRAAPRWLSGLLVLALMARFAVPVAVLGSDAVFRYFLEDRYEASEAAVSREAAAVEPPPALDPAAAPPAQEAGKGWLQSLRDLWDGTRQGIEGIDIRPKLAGLKARAEETVRHVVWLIVVFLLQTLVAPLAILWGLYAVLRNVVTPGGRVIVVESGRDEGKGAERT